MTSLPQKEGTPSQRAAPAHSAQPCCRTSPGHGLLLRLPQHLLLSSHGLHHQGRGCRGAPGAGHPGLRPPPSFFPWGGYSEAPTLSFWYQISSSFSGSCLSLNNKTSSSRAESWGGTTRGTHSTHLGGSAWLGGCSCHLLAMDKRGGQAPGAQDPGDEQVGDG